ncbi:c-type cytochrome [Seohaeicola nanhaiensis]|uniref:C-type cytochrome n=1 Tax=Seohaeicola nanhaiensis TaxID=1387282 RepID=A0ABV9KJY7_9RHOB
MTRGLAIALALCAGLFAAVALATSLAPPVRLFDTLHGWVRGHDMPDHVDGPEDPGALRRAAVHYDLVCATCHASPADPRRGEDLALKPPAPRLHDRIADWPASLLFETVKNGIAGSAMPAWAAPHRDDEIWAMVAFLRRLPSLDAAAYAELAATRTLAGDEAAPACLRCHQPDLDAAPKLSIQTPTYLSDALRAYRGGARKSGYMQSVAVRLSDANIERLAQRFGEAEPVQLDPEGAPDLAASGHPGRKAGACVGCHSGAANPAFPRLAGQHEDYLATQLRLFTQAPENRGGGPYIELMRHAAGRLTEDQVAKLAAWFSTR